MSARILLRRTHTVLSKRMMGTITRQNQTLNLPDGRVLGFAEYGSPNGKPLIYFHGYPSSRLEAEPMDDMARRAGVRVLALDRPGFGMSTPQPGRRIIDWPADVQAFAQSMKLSRFAIMGLSGGGPYAVACAHLMPREMLTGVGLFATGPPWEAGKHHMSLLRQMTRANAHYWPRGLQAILSATVGVLRWITSRSFVTRRIDRWLEKEKEMQKADGVSSSSQKRTTAERRHNLFHIVWEEPFLQGAEAATHEAKLLSSDDWGFRLEGVEYDPIRIWHGVKDKNAPIVMIRYLAEKLPHSTLREYEGDSHYTMFKHLEAALLELVPNEESDRPQQETRKPF